MSVRSVLTVNSPVTTVLQVTLTPLRSASLDACEGVLPPRDARRSQPFLTNESYADEQATARWSDWWTESELATSVHVPASLHLFAILRASTDPGGCSSNGALSYTTHYVLVRPALTDSLAGAYFCLSVCLGLCWSVFGACDHPFHMHCLEKWLKSQREGQEVCPLCRAEWQYKQS